MAKKLDPEILQRLNKKTRKSIGTLRKEISLAKREFPNATSNAAAQIIARKHGTSVLQRLDKEDRASVPQASGVSIISETPKRVHQGGKERERNSKAPLFKYDTTDYFKLRHIKELFKANSSGCYTCVFILFRKIIENLLIDILRGKFPGKGKDHVDLYFNITQKRFRDFSEILESLKMTKNQFGIDGETVIDRIIQLTKPFKKDANDKAHSWFHIVETENEILDIPIETIIELIKKLETVVGIRGNSGTV